MASPHPLIGRGRERALLAQRAAGALDGAGATILLRGEAGAGKTALARQAIAAAGLDRVDGFAQPGRRDAHRPLADVLRQLGRLRPDAASECAPALAALDSAEPGDTVAAALAAAAARRPLAIVLDDLHHADAATLELLPGLARALASAPVLLLIAYRDDEVGGDHPIRTLRSALRRDERL